MLGAHTMRGAIKSKSAGPETPENLYLAMVALRWFSANVNKFQYLLLVGGGGGRIHPSAARLTLHATGIKYES